MSSEYQSLSPAESCTSLLIGTFLLELLSHSAYDLLWFLVKLRFIGGFCLCRRNGIVKLKLKSETTHLLNAGF